MENTTPQPAAVATPAPAPVVVPQPAVAVPTPQPAAVATPAPAPVAVPQPASADAQLLQNPLVRAELAAAYAAGRKDQAKGHKAATTPPAPVVPPVVPVVPATPVPTPAVPAPEGGTNLEAQALRARLEALEAQQAQAQAQATAATENAARTTAMGQVAGAITKYLGVNTAIAPALANQWLAEGKVQYDGTGVYLVEQGVTGADGKVGPRVTAIDAGVAAFARTDEGRRLMPLVPAGPGLAGPTAAAMGANPEARGQLPRSHKMRLALDHDVASLGRGR